VASRDLIIGLLYLAVLDLAAFARCGDGLGILRHLGFYVMGVAAVLLRKQNTIEEFS
jgi:hypothetical protein